MLATLATACSDDRQPLLIDEDEAITAYEFHVRPGNGVSVSEEQLPKIENAAAIAVPPPDGWTSLSVPDDLVVTGSS